MNSWSVDNYSLQNSVEVKFQLHLQLSLSALILPSIAALQDTQPFSSHAVQIEQKLPPT